MKRKKFYTFIVAENSSANLKKFTVEAKYIYALLGVFAVLFFLFMAFLADYFGLHVDQWRLSQLKRENKELSQKFVQMTGQMRDLEQKVQQVSDFSKKLQLITNVSPESINKQRGFGKIHTNAAILALSSHSPSNRRPAGSAELSHEKNSHRPINSGFSQSDELEMRIESLRGKSQLVKQDAWTLYTDLLEKQEILHNTPSILPVRGWVSSSFGYRNETIYSDHEPYFHRGVDIASTEGNPVVSTADGKVVYTGYDDSGYGNLVVVDHGYGLKTYYAHLAEIQTKTGKIVQRGEVIASVGNTGRSTGPHLHYEVRIYGVPVNPDNYILNKNDAFSASSMVWPSQ